MVGSAFEWQVEETISESPLIIVVIASLFPMIGEALVRVLALALYFVSRIPEHALQCLRLCRIQDLSSLSFRPVSKVHIWAQDLCVSRLAPSDDNVDAS